jgi:hypothetical protein
MSDYDKQRTEFAPCLDKLDSKGPVLFRQLSPYLFGKAELEFLKNLWGLGTE